MDRILRKPIVVISLAVLCTFLWGSAFPSVKAGYELFQIQNGTVADKMVFAGARFTAAGIVILLLLLCIPGNRPVVKKKDMSGIIILGFIQTFLQYLFFYIALSNMSGSKGSILNATGTFMVVIISHFVFQNDKLNRNKILGCILGFGGVLFVNLNGEADLGFSITAEGFMLLAALSFAIGSISTKFLVKTTNPLTLTAYQLTFGGMLLLASGFIKGGRIGAVSGEALALFAYLVLISSVGFGVWTLLIKYNEVSKISIFNCLTPVFGTLLSGIFLADDIFKIQNLFALILVVAGIYLVNLKSKRTGLQMRNDR